MMDISKNLHRMWLLSDADAMKLVAELVRALLCDTTDAKVKQLCKEATEIFQEGQEHVWSKFVDAVTLAAIPPGLNSARANDELSYSYEHQDIFNKLATFCIDRQKRLDAIRQTMTPGAMRFVPKLTNLDKNNIVVELKRRIAALGLSDDYRFRLPPAMTAARILNLLNAMREAIIQKDMGAAYSDPATMDILDELEALYGVLLYYFDQQQRQGLTVNFSLCALPGFVYCDKCWRLIPESYARRQMSRCDLHNYESGKSTDSRKAKGVHDIVSAENPVFPRAAEKKLAEIDAAFCKPRYGGILEEDWLHVIENDLAVPDVVGALPSVRYDLEQVWKMCPRTREFILRGSGNLNSMESILSVLDPHMADETPEEHITRDTLHAFLAKNFWFYRQELALVEIWLTTHDTLYAGRKHGGARPNSGGKRPGAGRPKKSPAQS